MLSYRVKNIIYDEQIKRSMGQEQHNEHQDCSDKRVSRQGVTSDKTQCGVGSGAHGQQSNTDGTSQEEG